MLIYMNNYENLIKNLCPYKKIELNNEKNLQFFLNKHSTKEGTWGYLELKKGEVDFIFLDGNGKELSRRSLHEAHPTLLVPPACWHKLLPKGPELDATLTFYCQPHRYFEKKYGLAPLHHDLRYVQQTYLQNKKQMTILDVGCGSGRNPLYFAMAGHHVTGLDNNKHAIQNIQSIAEKEQLSAIKLKLHDLNFPLPSLDAVFDFIYCTVTLQFLDKTRIKPLLTQLQQYTAAGGMNFFVFPVQAEPYSYPHSFTYLPEPKELYHFYQDSGWSILEYHEKPGQLHKLDATGKPKQGMFALLLAQKHLAI